jgi:hypothetical protein
VKTDILFQFEPGKKYKINCGACSNEGHVLDFPLCSKVVVMLLKIVMARVAAVITDSGLLVPVLPVDGSATTVSL